MNNNLAKVLFIAAVTVLVLGALGVLGLGVAFAQDPTPDNPFIPRGMRGGFWGRQDNSGWTDAMHNWMASNGGMHIEVWESLADALGLSVDELSDELSSGKTLVELAEEKGLTQADLGAVLERTHQEELAEAVAAGVLTEEQADAMLEGMNGRYEWMLDNMGIGAGYGARGWRGGMMGGFYGRSGTNGEFAPGWCHGYYAPDASEINP